MHPLGGDKHKEEATTPLDMLPSLIQIGIHSASIAEEKGTLPKNVALPIILR
jgi:hypothetical protein